MKPVGDLECITIQLAFDMIHFTLPKGWNNYSRKSNKKIWLLTIDATVNMFSSVVVSKDGSTKLLRKSDNNRRWLR